MRLSDTDILQSLQQRSIIIDPEPDHSAISGVSVDLHLDGGFRTFNAQEEVPIDLGQKAAAMIERVMFPMIHIQRGGAFILHPGELVLAHTIETVSIPDDLVGWLDGRSSLARLGLMVHVTAHRIDPGWDGQIVLECFNAGKLPLILRPGMAIAAISFETLSSPAQRPYRTRTDAKYHQQRGPVMSRIGEDHGTDVSEAQANPVAECAALVSRESAIEQWALAGRNATTRSSVMPTSR